jgi:GH15 family glucan-1,4-alpha-glucosidase
VDSLELGVIGNCSFGALIDTLGRVVWCCLPRFDSDPVFCRLLDGGREEAPDGRGIYQIELKGLARSEQHYVRNTAVLATRLYDENGGAVEITDYAPRFGQLGRMYRPTTIVRLLRPLAGAPSVRVLLRPAHSYGAGQPEITHGSNHIRYAGPEHVLRLTTDAPLAYILDETVFVLEEPITLILGPDETFARPIAESGQQFLDLTVDYWHDWVRHLAVPVEWQEAVIRAAITLKLCSFEETGAMIAAMTTSIPEAAKSGRNWDYRYCWLRDAFLVVRALNQLGAAVMMENYLRYVTNIVAAAEDGRLQPVYGIALEKRLPEHNVATLNGYRGMGPVRRGNQAFVQVQNDVYGAVVLASARAFFDTRLLRPASIDDYGRLEIIGERAFEVHDQSDAGIWELRTRAEVHTSSMLMCWAACDRLAKIAIHLELQQRARHWAERADRVAATIHERCWNGDVESFVSTVGGSDVDASLLLMAEVGFIDPAAERFTATLRLIEKTLRRGDHMLRYVAPDDFGSPENAFNICTFWYIEGLAAAGRWQEAREIFENVLACRNHLGLLSEDVDIGSGELWGNFPQTYSLVGLINCATRLSRRWE